MIPAIALIAFAWWYFGAIPQLKAALMSISTIAGIIVVLNIFRQFMLPHFKSGEVIKKAMGHPIGAGLIFFAVMFFLSLIVFITMAKADTMLDRASPWLPVIERNYEKHWDSAPYKHFLPAQVEQESLWKQFAQLKTSRELGRGFGQLTIAYTSTGAVRFNKYTEAVQRFKELKGWDWQNDPFHAEYQLLFVVLEDYKNFITYQKTFSTDKDRWAATLVCYNAGCGTVRNRWAICSKTVGCDDTKWFGGLDTVASASEASATLYGRSLAAERNKYPKLVIETRSPKYENYFLCITCHPRGGTDES